MRAGRALTTLGDTHTSATPVKWRALTGVSTVRPACRRHLINRCANTTVFDTLELGVAELPDSADTINGVVETALANASNATTSTPHHETAETSAAPDADTLRTLTNKRPAQF